MAKWRARVWAVFLRKVFGGVGVADVGGVEGGTFEEAEGFEVLGGGGEGGGGAEFSEDERDGGGGGPDFESGGREGCGPG